MKNIIQLVRPLTNALGTADGSIISISYAIRRIIILATVLTSIVFLIHCPTALLAEDTNAVVLGGTYSYGDIFNGTFTAAGMETESRGDFKVEIEGKSWIIDYNSYSAATNHGESYASVTASCDGTNVYVVHRWNLINVTNPKAVTTDARIYPGTLLPSLEADVYHLWIAFVSSTEWTNASGKAKPKISDLSMLYNTNCECTYLWNTNNNDGSVRTLILKTGGRIFGRDIQDNGKLKSFSLPAPYQDGYILAEGVWQKVTNVAGILVPVEFMFSDFTPKANAASSTDLTVVDHFLCHVTNVYTAALPPIPVGLQGSTQMVLVDDHRFWQQEHPTVTYAVTTNKWESKLGSNFLARLTSMPKISLENESLKRFGFKASDEFTGGVSKAIIVRSLIGMTILLPAAIIVWQQVKNRAKTKNKQNENKTTDN